MTQLKDLACRLLYVEQQLIAYQKLHTDELAELWQTLHQGKREIAAALPEFGIEVYEPIPAPDVSSERQEQTEEK